MRSSMIRSIFAATVIALASASATQAVEFGKPDYSNYMSRPGLVSCDWQYESYTRACPTPEEPPKVQAPVKSAGKSKVKTKKAN